MASNDKLLLDQLLIEKKSEIAPDYKEDEFFEFFVAEQLLKSYQLSYDELDTGLVGGGGDGGIDAFYTFVDERIVTTDFELNGSKPKAIKVIIVQAKRESSFKVNSITTLMSTLDELFDFGKTSRDLRPVYNSQLLDGIDNFKRVWRESVLSFPSLHVEISYVTKGDKDQVHPNVRSQIPRLEEAVRRRFSDFSIDFHFLGSRDLIEMSRQEVSHSLELKITESLSSSDGGYVCLVTLSNYNSFISAGMHRLQMLFDANVREYEGSVEVNRGIQTTLQEKDQNLDFWWLNNGITIIASKAMLSSKILSLEDAKVVNGLQTSHEIFKYFNDKDSSDNDTRLLLVRIIVTQDEKVRNAIIRATNSQSRIQAYSLRATETVHFDIEQHLRFNGLYYDRQKNYYKNQGKRKSLIVSIQNVATAVASTLLMRPNDARGRPSKLLQDDIYDEMFKEEYHLDLYLKSVLLLRLVDSHLRSCKEEIRSERINILFQLLMFVAASHLGTVSPSASQIASLNIDDFDADYLDSQIVEVWPIFVNLREQSLYDGGKVGKSKEFDNQLISLLQSKVNVAN